jgi:uncharacterized membrane protein
MEPYLFAKWLHVLSSTVLFGTGMGTAFQMVWAMREGSAGQVARTAGGVVVADWIFTTPAGLIQPATGLWLIHEAGYSPTEPWLLAAYGLYALAFLCWAPVVHLQLRIRDLCRAAPPDGPVPDQARNLYAIWFALGWPAFAALVGIFWLMISKPVFI